jgi:hypothetical protein
MPTRETTSRTSDSAGNGSTGEPGSSRPTSTTTTSNRAAPAAVSRPGREASNVTAARAWSAPSVRDGVQQVAEVAGMGQDVDRVTWAGSTSGVHREPPVARSWPPGWLERLGVDTAPQGEGLAGTPLRERCPRSEVTTS